MKRKHCTDFDNPDPRFSYENDGCGACANQRKYPPVTIPYLRAPSFQKCLKGHVVGRYLFREEALKKSLTKQKNFVVQFKLPEKVSSDVLKEKLEQVLQSEVMILMEGIGTRGAGFVDSEFIDADELDELGLTPSDDEKSSTTLEEPESLPEEPQEEKPE